MLGQQYARRDNARAKLTAHPLWASQLNLATTLVFGCLIATAVLVPEPVNTLLPRLLFLSFIVLLAVFVLARTAYDLNRYYLACKLVANMGYFQQQLRWHKRCVEFTGNDGLPYIVGADRQIVHMNRYEQLYVALEFLRYLSNGDRRWYSPGGIRNHLRHMRPQMIAFLPTTIVPYDSKEQ